MRSGPGIGFEYRPSRWPRVMLLVMGALALAATVASGLSAWLSAAVCIAIAAWVRAAWRRAGTSRVREVLRREDGGWQLRLRGDTAVAAELLDARVLAGAIILRLRWAPRQREALLLFPDNLDADTRRRLRMRLSADADTE